MSCQTCSSELPPHLFRQAFITPCCSSPICNGCISRNPRLKEYIPCLRCGDPRTVELKGAACRIGKERPIVNDNGSSNRINQRESEIIGGTGEVVFEVGEDEEEEEEEEEEGELPPNYEDIHPSQSKEIQVVETTHQIQPDREGHISREGVENIHGHVDEDVDEDDEALETVEITHQIQRGDTLLSIARKYATDPHDLLTLNSLPPSALSTHPRILHTRKSIIINRRQIPLSKLPLSQRLNPITAEDEDEKENQKDKEEREKQKQLKRFQLLTKNTDDQIANTYLSLSELDENKDISHFTGSGETLDGKKMIIDKSNREERALESFFEDDEWEKQVKLDKRKQGKWKIIGNGSASASGSSLKAKG
ncbi:uncharacterized protein IL334_006370 [Kwoniella shivajii]|uniref:LysM domain-containing protein n=1 Tax=Kwoniella shivajii TaxID=564305 RepID=A0ABZ1D5S1_9TREE|nr:hypothetical protein IL334_006370 [Kwoniella shivajii]